jgi:hypothetical protein
MPFIARCIFCNHRTQAPDRALGASGRCPKCSSFFTVVPEQEEPAAVCAATAHAAAAATAAPGPSPAPQPAAASGPGQGTSALPPQAEQPVQPPRPRRETVRPPALDGFGLIALLMGGAGLAFALCEGGTGHAAVASFLGFITGVAGVIRSKLVGWATPKSAALATMLSAGVCCFAAYSTASSGPAARPVENVPAVAPAAPRAPEPAAAEDVPGPLPAAIVPPPKGRSKQVLLLDAQ